MARRARRGRVRAALNAGAANTRAGRFGSDTSRIRRTVSANELRAVLPAGGVRHLACARVAGAGWTIGYRHAVGTRARLLISAPCARRAMARGGASREYDRRLHACGGATVCSRCRSLLSARLAQRLLSRVWAREIRGRRDRRRHRRVSGGGCTNRRRLSPFTGTPARCHRTRALAGGGKTLLANEWRFRTLQKWLPLVLPSGEITERENRVRKNLFAYEKLSAPCRIFQEGQNGRAVNRR